jgi:hypothetical protein
MALCELSLLLIAYTAVLKLNGQIMENIDMQFGSCKLININPTQPLRSSGVKKNTES